MKTFIVLDPYDFYSSVSRYTDYALFRNVCSNFAVGSSLGQLLQARLPFFIDNGRVRVSSYAKKIVDNAIEISKAVAPNSNGVFALMNYFAVWVGESVHPRLMEICADFEEHNVDINNHFISINFDKDRTLDYIESTGASPTHIVLVVDCVLHLPLSETHPSENDTPTI